ncbi:transposase, partial [Streptomyces marokkonensis]|uniref:transposase n=1 Tax=Streptomyces marokkonensis TaxID=324855 RepID=UPI003CD063C8
EEVAPGGKQVPKRVHRGVQAGRDRARRLLGQDGHHRRPGTRNQLESLRGWYRKAKADRGEGESGELTSAEREELKRLRKEVREQQQTIEILKKATAFFVKENDR